MAKTILAILVVIPAAFLAGCVTTTNYHGYNSDYGYWGKIYPGSVSNVSYGSDFGKGYGLNYGVNDYLPGNGVDDYGLGYGIVDYGTVPNDRGNYY